MYHHFWKKSRYPTPFELHFSNTHLGWYQANPDDYIAKMRGVDKDLAAHITVLRYRGQAIYGTAIHEVFAEVPVTDYWDSIYSDISDAETEIADNPMYIILNLCRVLAYRKDREILSKLEGGAWGLAHIPQRYHTLISDALTAYRADGTIEIDKTLAGEFAKYMLNQINGQAKYYEKYEQRYQAVHAVGGSWGFTSDNADLIRVLTQWVHDNHLEGKRIIEFACGEGAAGKILTDLGCIYHGVDLATSAVEKARALLADVPNATVSRLDMVRDSVTETYDAALDVMGFHILITDQDSAWFQADPCCFTGRHIVLTHMKDRWTAMSNGLR